MSTCDLMQLTHMLEGLGGILVPQRQQSLGLRGVMIDREEGGEWCAAYYVRLACMCFALCCCLFMLLKHQLIHATRGRPNRDARASAAAAHQQQRQTAKGSRRHAAVSCGRAPTAAPCWPGWPCSGMQQRLLLITCKRSPRSQALTHGPGSAAAGTRPGRRAAPARRETWPLLPCACWSCRQRQRFQCVVARCCSSGGGGGL